MKYRTIVKAGERFLVGRYAKFLTHTIENDICNSRHLITQEKPIFSHNELSKFISGNPDQAQYIQQTDETV